MAKVIARRKGRSYRTFDTSTARMGPWERVPLAPVAFIEGYADGVRNQTVPTLRRWLESGRPGVRVPAKARKADLIQALAQRAWERSYHLGDVVQ